MIKTTTHKWIKYENGVFCSDIQNTKGKGNNWIPAILLAPPTPERPKQVKLKKDGEDVCYIVYVPKNVSAKDITHTTKTS